VFENYPRPEQEDSIQVTYQKTIEKYDYPFTLRVYEIRQSLQIQLEFDESYLIKQHALSYVQELALTLEKISRLLNKSERVIKDVLEYS
jgi:hypothetical protein